MINRSILDNPYFDIEHIETIPTEILEFLSELSLLYHVPFSYIMPNGEAFQKEEIRFFTVSHNWILYLLDGLCSIGRTASVDYQHDIALLEGVYERALNKGAEIRMKKQNRTIGFRDLENDTIGTCSGFLLYSDLVSGWRGLECKAYGSQNGNDKLETIRLDTLGDLLLIGIFKGEIKRLEIAQPPEGLHFGYYHESNHSFQMLRDETKGEPNQKKAEVVLKNQGKHRVVDVLSTKINMEKQLGRVGRSMDSAEFSLQMIKNALTGVFTLKE